MLLHAYHTTNHDDGESGQQLHRAKLVLKKASSSLLQFYFDDVTPRNCTALIVIGNLFGLISFRYSILYMLNALGMSLNAFNIRSKIACALAHATFLVSAVTLLYNVLDAPIIVPATCSQTLSPTYTTINNAFFLISFVISAAPVVYVLGTHIGESQNTPKFVKQIYKRQMYFIVVFSTLYIGILVVQWFIKEFSWLLLTFVVQDIVWQNGLAMFLMSDAKADEGEDLPSGSQKRKQTVADLERHLSITKKNPIESGIAGAEPRIRIASKPMDEKEEEAACW